MQKAEARPGGSVSQLREEILQELSMPTNFDVLIIGGGIHGATFAYLAAYHGLKVALLEKRDYASATSSRSSKMAHGGLRYLEMFDFKQVFEGIHARETLYEICHHLVEPAPFLIPVPEKRFLFKSKLSIGLFLYDLLAKSKERKHSWIPSAELKYSELKVSGCFQYFDGRLDDARLTLDFIQAARGLGATCLNYADVVEITNAHGHKHVGWRDVLTNSIHQSLARTIVNCAGPWASKNLTTTPHINSHQLKFSRGIHLIFNRPWSGPSLFLPMSGKSRYYFVWPHEAGTMVGTTEREVETPEWDPIPRPDEVNEILDRLAADIPNAHLNRDSLQYGFAGIRALPLRGNKKNTTTLSRRHLWTSESNIFTLFGGKLTSALSTSLDGLKLVSTALGSGKDRLSIPNKKIRVPISELQSKRLQNQATDLKLPSRLVKRLEQRFGQDIEFFLSSSDRLLPLGPRARGEIEFASRFEQAESLDDLMRVRLQYEFFEGNGLEVLPEISRLFKISKTNVNLETELTKYRSKILKIRRELGLTEVSSENLTTPSSYFLGEEQYAAGG